MKAAAFVAIALVVAVVIGVVVWRTSDDDSRREGALIQGVTGPVMSSPSGDFSLSVQDNGIVMKGPSSSVELTGAGLLLKSTGTLSIQGSGPGVTVQGAIVNLCGGGGKPVARQGDPVVVSGLGAPGQITQGSTTTFVC